MTDINTIPKVHAATLELGDFDPANPIKATVVLTMSAKDSPDVKFELDGLAVALLSLTLGPIMRQMTSALKATEAAKGPIIPDSPEGIDS